MIGFPERVRALRGSWPFRRSLRLTAPVTRVAVTTQVVVFVLATLLPSWEPAYAQACRPAVAVSSSVLAVSGVQASAMLVSLQAVASVSGGDKLHRVRFTGATNATVEVNGLTQAVPSTVTVNPATAGWSFVVRKKSAAGPFTVHFVATDSCGDVPKFVGHGTAAVVDEPGGGDVILRPTPIALSAGEIGNPMRGSHLWHDLAPVPPGWPIVDAYNRYDWRQLEPARDQYDFSAIDQQLARAASRRGKFGLRVMAANSLGTQAVVPQYLVSLMPGGFWLTLDGVRSYAPDWNDPDFLDRARRLLNALGQRYGNDPRLGWVDIGIYGDWGEWHVWRWPYTPSPTGATPATTATKRAIVDMHIAAFPNTQLVMMSDDGEGLGYAMDRSPTIGWRRDCLGNALFDDVTTKSGWSKAAERWRTAPVITEYCYQSPGSGGFQRAVAQVQKFHVAMIGNGNLASWNSFSAQEQAYFIDANKRAGYRYVLNTFTLHGHASAGGVFAVVSQWTNAGATPTYTPWRYQIQLRTRTSGAVAWQGTSALDLRTVLPANVAGAAAHEDRFILPASLAPGQYDVVIVVEDARAYSLPMALAITGRRSDGSYLLGTTTVHAAGSAP